MQELIACLARPTTNPDGAASWDTPAHDTEDFYDACLEFPRLSASLAINALILLYECLDDHKMANRSHGRSIIQRTE
jgi:hypothetical protein